MALTLATFAIGPAQRWGTTRQTAKVRSRGVKRVPTAIRPRKWEVRSASTVDYEVKYEGMDMTDPGWVANVQREKMKGLDNPVQVAASATSKTSVTDAGDSVAMSKYLSLPVEQYTSDVLAGGEVSRIGTDLFMLTVPKLQLFDVWLLPRIVVLVNPVKPSKKNIVRITAVDCELSGSELIQKMHLSEKVVVQMETTLEFDDTKQELCASADLNVFTEVIKPFHLVPRGVLVGTTNTVVQTLMNAMLAIFVKKVGQDYVRWSTDEIYRETRAETKQ